MTILAVDIGGTKVRLALATPRTDRFDIRCVETYPSTSFATLDLLIGHYLDQQGARVDAAGVAVAGPVVAGKAALTNLPWTVAADELAAALSLPAVAMLNDLEGLAWSIARLPAASIATLQDGAAVPRGNRALIAAGTGLGQAILFETGDDHVPSATEGGHCDFAPVDDLDCELLRYLTGRYGRVSWERVVSGPALATLYEFLLERSATAAPDWFLSLPDHERPAAVSGHALSGDDPLAAEAMRLFVVYYGREAGNLALKAKATGGLYIGGGVAPKILAALKRPAFLEAFNAKGRMRPLMASMPVRVILDETAALGGIARYAQVHAAT